MKLPHWVIVVLSAVLSASTWLLVQSSSGQLPIPAVWLGVISQTAIIVKAILAITSDSPATAAKLARMGVKLASAFTMFVILFAFGCQGCTKEQGQTIIPPVVDVSTCIIRVIADDVAAGKTWAQASDDAIAQCLLGHAPTSDAERATYAPIVEREWSAVEGADAKRGLVPRPIAGRHVLVFPAPASSAP